MVKKYHIFFTDWEEDIKKVSLARLFKDSGLMSLSESKRAVDGLLLGYSFSIATDDKTKAINLKKKATELGAVCTLYFDIVSLGRR